MIARHCLCGAVLTRPQSLAAGECYECRLSDQMPELPPDWTPPSARRRAATEARFWSKVDKTESGCWLWTAGKIRGYGSFHVDGCTVLAHRWAYELMVGPIPDDMELDHRHTCPKNCVNPDHLRPATHKQNLQNLAGATTRSATGIRGVYRYRGKLRVEVGRHKGGIFDRTVLAMQAAIWLRNELYTHNDADRVDGHPHSKVPVTADMVAMLP